VQTRVRKELEEAFPSGQLPRWEERNRIPLMEALLHEVQRLADLAPLGVPHIAQKDCTVGQYFIPKDTVVLAHLGFLHNDPLLFPEPNKFR